MPTLPASKPVIPAVLELLVERNLLKPPEALFLRTKYHAPLELANVLIGKKIVTADELAKIFAATLNMPFVRLEGINIPAEVLKKIPHETAVRRLVVAFEETPTALKLALAEPYRLSQVSGGPLHNLSHSIGKKIEIVVTPKKDILQALKQYQPTAQPSPGPTIRAIDLERMVISPEVLKKFPQEIAKKYQMVVFEAPSEREIKVAAVSPQDPKVEEILQFLRQRNGINITLYKTSKQGIEQALTGYEVAAQPKPTPSPQATNPPPLAVKPKPSSQLAPEISPEFEETDIDKLLGKTIKTQEELAAEVSSGFVPRVVGAILSFAVVLRASDVHLEPMKDFFRLRYRIDGQLQEILRLPLVLHAPVVSRVKILSRMKIDEKRIPQDGRFEIMVSAHDIDIRVASLPTIFGEKLLLRLLDKSQAMLTLEKIGLEGRNLDLVKQEISKPWGLILSTGPTGSGKSTTLYGILQKLSTTRVNIITLEDPIEYEIPGINQSQVKPKIGYSFAEGLRSVLRQDPNIIMVGEIRDRETAELATQAALTGHLVLSTLHTNDAASSISRLINIGVEPFLITSATNCILGQRLVRRLCEQCRKQAVLPAPLIDEINELMAGVAGIDAKMATFYSPVGCKQCSSGYKGRLGIFEVMAISPQIEHLAVARRPASEIEKIARSEGMLTMRQDGVIKAIRGITSLDEVWKATTQ